MNEDKNTTYQNLRDAAIVILKGKFMAVNTYIKKEEISQSNNFLF